MYRTKHQPSVYALRDSATGLYIADGKALSLKRKADDATVFPATQAGLRELTEFASERLSGQVYEVDRIDPARLTT